MDTITMPYKIQIFIPDTLRRQLKSLAHEKNTSLQKLVVALLTVGTEDAASTVLPAVDRHLAQEDTSHASPPNRHLIRGEVIAGQ